MGWGDIIGSAINYESNDREKHKKGRAVTRYSKAWEQLSNLDKRDEQALEGRLRDLSLEGGRSYEQLARSLSGQDRIDAGQTGRADVGGRLMYALAPAQERSRVSMRPATGVAPAAGNAWAQHAMAGYAPRLSSQANLIGEQGAQEGYRDFDTAAFQRQGEESTDIARRRAESQRYNAGMKSFREGLLGDEARRFKYQGPSNSFYNMQLMAQLAGAAGNYQKG